MAKKGKSPLSKRSSELLKRGTPLDVEVKYESDSKHLEKERTSYLLKTTLKYSWMMPSWLRFLSIVVSQEPNSEELAACFALPHYRQASMVIYQGFWQDDIDETTRERVILEEITHMLQFNVGIWAENVISNYVPEDQRAYVHAMYSEAIERDVHEVMEVVEKLSPIE